jgi:hypothetical protein
MGYWQTRPLTYHQEITPDKLPELCYSRFKNIASDIAIIM